GSRRDPRGLEPHRCRASFVRTAGPGTALCVSRRRSGFAPNWSLPHASRLCGSEYFVVVGVVRRFFDVFDVLNRVVGTDDEHRSSEATVQWSALDEYAVIFAELRVAVGRQRL